MSNNVNNSNVYLKLCFACQRNLTHVDYEDYIYSFFKYDD